MTPTPFELTPEQKGLLETLSRETGKPVSTLIAEALQGLEAQVHLAPANGDTGISDHSELQEPPRKHIWDIADELFGEIPDEELDHMPIDGSFQHDHYIYGTPKRPT